MKSLLMNEMQASDNKVSSGVQDKERNKLMDWVLGVFWFSGKKEMSSSGLMG